MSSNNVVWVFPYKGYLHVFYSGCIDNEPKEPDYDNKYYKMFGDRAKALTYAHDVVNKIDRESYAEGFPGIEYGVVELPYVDDEEEVPDGYVDLRQEINELKMKVNSCAFITNEEGWKEQSNNNFTRLNKLKNEIGEDKINCGLSLWEVVQNLSKGLIMKHPSAENAHCSIDVCLKSIYEKIDKLEKQMSNYPFLHWRNDVYDWIKRYTNTEGFVGIFKKITDLEKKLNEEIKSRSNWEKAYLKADKEISELKKQFDKREQHQFMDYEILKNIKESLRVVREGSISLLKDKKAHQGLRLHENVFLDNLKNLDDKESNKIYGITEQIEIIDEYISEWKQKIKDLQFSIEQFEQWKNELI